MPFKLFAKLFYIFDIIFEKKLLLTLEQLEQNSLRPVL
jgi:hypothetical protein